MVVYSVEGLVEYSTLFLIELELGGVSLGALFLEISFFILVCAFGDVVPISKNLAST